MRTQNQASDSDLNHIVTLTAGLLASGHYHPEYIPRWREVPRVIGQAFELFCLIKAELAAKREAVSLRTDSGNGTAKIELKRTRTIPALAALVDAVDAKEQGAFKWSVMRKTFWDANCNPTPSYTVYRTVGRRKIYLHREIMKPGDGCRIRFRDGNGLNCTRNNLVIVQS